MGKRGAKPKGKVEIKWSANFAYAIGLLVTDGCLSSDGRHITLTSKDVDQLENFLKCLKIKCKIGASNNGLGQTAFRVQFGDIMFFRFLESIGIMKNKSLILREIKVPDELFFDFLRGCFDGDGCFYSYWDPRWRSSFMFYTEFCSASPRFIKWLQLKIKELAEIYGHVTTSGKESYMKQLKYAKKESLILLKKMYHSNQSIFLSRKRLKINKALGIVGEKI